MGSADAAEVEEEKCIICNGPIELENIKKDSTVKRCKSLPKGSAPLTACKIGSSAIL
jgi:hypothetical protein